MAQAHGTGICKALEYAAARERHILAPLYAVPLPRYYCRKISIQGAALHKVGPQTCAAPCCCIKWRLAYCGAMGLCHPFFQGGNSIVLPPLWGVGEHSMYTQFAMQHHNLSSNPTLLSSKNSISGGDLGQALVRYGNIRHVACR